MKTDRHTSSSWAVQQMRFNTSSENTHRWLLITVRSLTSQSSHMRLFPSIPLVCFLCFLTPVKMALLPVVVVSASGTGFKNGWNLSADTRHHRTGREKRNVTLPSPQQVNKISSARQTSLKHKQVYWRVSEWNQICFTSKTTNMTKKGLNVNGIHKHALHEHIP